MQAEHLWSRRTIDVGIKQSYTGSPGCQPDSKIHRDRGFTDPPFPGSHHNHLTHPWNGPPIEFETEGARTPRHRNWRLASPSSGLGAAKIHRQSPRATSTNRLFNRKFTIKTQAVRGDLDLDARWPIDHLKQPSRSGRLRLGLRQR